MANTNKIPKCHLGSSRKCCIHIFPTVKKMRQKCKKIGLMNYSKMKQNELETKLKNFGYVWDIDTQKMKKTAKSAKVECSVRERSNTTKTKKGRCSPACQMNTRPTIAIMREECKKLRKKYNIYIRGYSKMSADLLYNELTLKGVLWDGRNLIKARDEDDSLLKQTNIIQTS